MSPSVWTCNACDAALRADPGDRASVERAMLAHADRCPEYTRRRRGALALRGYVTSGRDERAEEEFQLQAVAA